MRRMKGMGTLPMTSLLASIITLLVIMAIIDPDLASWAFGVALFIVLEVVDRAQPERIENFLRWWDNRAALIHWGLLFTILGFMGWLYDFFMKNFKIVFNIVPSNSTSTN